MVLQADQEVKTACLVAQAFARMIRGQDASALEPWLEEAENLCVPDLLVVFGVTMLPLLLPHGVRARRKVRFIVSSS